MLAGVALVMTAALAAAGCTSAPAGTATAGAPAAGAAPAVTAAQARQVFGSYTAAWNRAIAVGDQALVLASASGVERAVLNAARESAQDSRERLSLPRYRYGTPAFYLPEQTGYPRWFVADVTRTAAGVPAGTGMSGPAGVALGGSGRVLMLFEQTRPAGGWQLASTSQVPPGESVPALAADGAGHVPVVPLSDTALLARPDVTGALQAAVVDDGPASAAAQVVAGGPLTTGLYRTERASLLGLRAPRGDVYLWELEGSHYGRFALRTADGGALVFYAMYLNTTVEVPAVLNKGVVKPGPPITVPGYLAPLLPPGKTAPRVSLEAQQLLSFAAVDPPSGDGGDGTGNGKIQVIAIGGGLSYANAS
jgi:hypothetical protein